MNSDKVIGSLFVIFIWSMTIGAVLATQNILIVLASILIGIGLVSGLLAISVMCLRD